ncbi:tRNA lysidine(34) synthetase TilS [Acidovorax sp. RAC01]|uniref:tRNA lysidine(34) synthetase TilS n=1 Tax=Acidovorax sp. RAC01 TaxID=1842533 RepID=UPI00083E7911|nr:tRNA lysidine(34) synthetase TilS [Acidovorax sp. RAC01]AOG21956.1 tRNA(Ile)-lysidine synthetase [Acidovorax sp. RAC01]
MAQRFEAAIECFAPTLPLAIGLSGGADSTALAVACARRWPGQIQAIHVHHGLQPAADGFARHCEALCSTLGVALTVCRVNATAAPGQSPEDAARKARYEAFDTVALAANGSFAIKSIALAQHADDQAETLLLALSRGAGVAGLAAMPARWERGGVAWHRPLLQVPGADVRRWLLEQGIAWVEDPTNSDTRFTRNRIRAQLLPAVEAVFPAFRDTFARTAANAWQAAGLLGEIAQEDLARVGVPPALAQLQQLSRARQANALRHWLRHHHQTTPSAAQLAEMLDQIAACTTRGHGIRLKMGRGFVVRSGLHLDWYDAGAMSA